MKSCVRPARRRINPSAMSAVLMSALAMLGLAGCASGGAGIGVGASAEPGVAQSDVDAMKEQMDRVALDLSAMAAEQEKREAQGLAQDDLPSLSLESLAAEGGPAGDAAGDRVPRDPPRPDLLAAEAPIFEVDPSLEPLGSRLALLDVPPALIRPEEAPEPAETPVERADRLARELDRALDEGAIDGPSAYRAALAKAGLGSHTGERPLPPPNLSITSQPLVEALADLHETLASHADDPVAHLDEAVDAADEFARRVSELANLRIPRVELCSRVDGFGQFTPLRSSKFLAGRATPVILYVEVEHFGDREIERDGKPLHRVELSQEVSLYRANETTPVWTKPAEPIIDVSLNRRRDFHIVHQIDIPASLKLGMYRMKVRMSDAVSGQIAEAMINIQVVTDERLLK